MAILYQLESHTSQGSTKDTSLHPSSQFGNCKYALGSLNSNIMSRTARKVISSSISWKGEMPYYAIQHWYMIYQSPFVDLCKELYRLTVVDITSSHAQYNTYITFFKKTLHNSGILSMWWFVKKTRLCVQKLIQLGIRKKHYKEAGHAQQS